MMRNELLLLIAREKAQKFISDSNVHAIIVTGSLSIDQADEASDIDMMVYYKDEPSESVLNTDRRLAEKSGGEISSSNVFVHRINGVRCEVGHFLVSPIDRIVNDVVEDYDTDLIKHQIATGILQSLPLNDKFGLIENWKKRLRNYPEELTVALVKKHIKYLYSKPSMIQTGVDREDWVFLAEMMLKMQENILGVMCGLNRMYHPGKMKRITHSISLMHLKPDNMLERIMRIWQVDPRNTVDILTQLVYETFDLIDRHLPQVSTVDAREKYEVLW